MSAPHNREDGELLVHCRDCNGYLWSDAQEKPLETTRLVSCPYRKANGDCRMAPSKARHS